MKNKFKILIANVLILTFTAPAMALTFDEFDSQQSSQARVKIPDETVEHWELATEYKSERRYELARQHFLLALATCNSSQQRDALQRELQMVDLQIRTLR